MKRSGSVTPRNRQQKSKAPDNLPSALGLPELISSLGLLLLVLFVPSRVPVLATLGTLVAVSLVVVGHDVDAGLGPDSLGRRLRRLAVAPSGVHRSGHDGYQKQKAERQTCVVHGESVSGVKPGSRRISGESGDVDVAQVAVRDDD